MKAKQYRHQPIRRVHTPKEGGKTRPIGVSAFEDKRVQDAVREVLEAIYEQNFLDCSDGDLEARYLGKRLTPFAGLPPPGSLQIVRYRTLRSPACPTYPHRALLLCGIPSSPWMN
jgi:hypothetical protein